MYTLQYHSNNAKLIGSLWSS